MNKLLSLILLLSLSLAFYSCGSDDDDEPEKFVWGGDWNDPDDPNYKPEYKGKYNPIQGLWKDEGKDTGLYFSDDFKPYTVKFFSNGSYVKNQWRVRYIINNKAFSLRPPNSEIWRYKLEGNKLYIYPNINDDKDPDILIKIEETMEDD